MVSSDIAMLSHGAAYNEENYPTVFRCMAFVDVSGFTNFTQTNGAHAAARMLTKFRNLLRAITGRHGIRVAKWLGDGAMLVGTRNYPVLEALIELQQACDELHITIHIGVCSGEIIIFEGDDYLGKVVNTAARLMAAATPGSMLTAGITKEELHDLPLRTTSLNYTLKGIGKVSNILQLSLQ